MALLVRGRSQCVICGRTIGELERATSFPAFVQNRSSPLHRFSDANVHSCCLANDELAQRAQRAVQELSVRLGPGNRDCEVCGSEISSPEDYFTFGFLTDEPSSRAFSLNWLQFHRTHLSEWDQLSESIEAIRRLAVVEHWHLDDVSPLLRVLKQAELHRD